MPARTVTRLTPRARGIISAPVDPVDPGGAYTEAVTTGEGRRRAVTVGNDYLLFRAGYYQLAAERDAVALVGNRLHWGGPYTAEHTGPVTQFFVGIKGGDVDQKIRPQIYVDAGSSDSTPQSSSSVGRPATLLAVGDELTIPAGAPAQWWPLTFPVRPSATAGQLVWLGVWAGPATSGSEAVFVATDGTRRHHRHAAQTYSSGGSPAASFASGATSIYGGVEISIYAVIAPTVTTGAMSVTAAAQSDLSVGVTLASVPAAATAVFIERSKNGGSYQPYATVPPTLTSVPDLDKQSGATYTYRATPLLRNGAGASVTSSTVTAAGTRRGYQAVIYSLTTAPVWNPMRGLVNWGAGGGGAYQLYAAAGTESFTDFDRTNITWRNLEPTLGNYSATPIEAVLARAATNGRRAGFRWRAMIQDGSGNNCPDYISTNSSYSTTTSNGTEPRWTVPYVQGRIQALWAWLKATYGAGRPGGIDPRIAFVDVGTLLRYGEWAGSWGSDPPTEAFALAVIGYAVDAFPTVPVVVNMPDYDLDGALYQAAELYPNLGWKYDSVGGWGFNDRNDCFTRLRGVRSERTRRHLRDPERPIFGESKASSNFKFPSTFQMTLEEVAGLGITGIHDTNYGGYAGWSGTAGAASRAALDAAYAAAGYRLGIAQAVLPLSIAAGGSFQLRLDWANTGNRPIHEPRSVKVQLRPALGGAPVWEGTSGINLRKVHATEGSPYTYQDSFTISGASANVYRLCVEIPALNANDEAVRLLNTAERVGDYYWLGNVTVT